MSVPRIKSILLYATMVIGLMAIFQGSAAAAVAPECSWNPEPTLIYDAKFKLPDGNSSSNFTEFPWNNTTTQAILFETTVTQGGSNDFMPSAVAGKYLMLLKSSASPQTIDVSTRAKMYVEYVGADLRLNYSTIATSNGVAGIIYRLNGTNGINPEAAKIATYGASAPNTGRAIATISCVKAWRNIIWSNTSGASGASIVTGTIPPSDGLWPVATPVPSWPGTSFRTATVSSGAGDTIVNAGDLTKEYVHNLVIKIAGFGAAAVVAIWIVKQFQFKRL